jgi:hypothetical protein
MRNPDPEPNGDDPARHPLLRARWRPLWCTLLLLTIVAVCALAFDPHPPPHRHRLGQAQPPAGVCDPGLLANGLLAVALAARAQPAGPAGLRRLHRLVQTQIPGRSGEYSTCWPMAWASSSACCCWRWRWR